MLEDFNYDFMTYHKPVVIKAVRYLHGNRQTVQWNRIESKQNYACPVNSFLIKPPKLFSE